jgi:hypothetical protein
MQQEQPLPFQKEAEEIDALIIDGGLSPADMIRVASYLEALAQRIQRETAIPEDLVFIWSDEHHAYWGPNRSGYYDNIVHAGVYKMQDAVSATSHCGPEKKIKIVLAKNELQKLFEQIFHQS